MKFTKKFWSTAFAISLCAGGIYAAYQSQSPRSLPLSAYAPSGALLAIESPDFKALLNAWTNSSEQKRWLASGNYAGFSRSRIFDRLGQAQDEFATTAGLPPDVRFLHQIAGTDSLLAWYDIGNLQFLYITHLASGAAANTPLLQLRDKFEERRSGDTTFYVRTQSDPGRTVAFAVQGDYLLLATREDLLANALQLMQHPADRTLNNDAWYSSTQSAPNAKPSDLSTSLNLTAIVRSPYFRSYWVQQNITEMKRYIAARSDLYRTADTLREERVLIAAKPDDQPTSADLSSALSYVPNGIGVYRAQAQPSTDEVLAQFDDKLLIRSAGKVHDSHAAPVASLSTPIAGDASDLDSRIDTPLAVVPTHAAALTPLHDLLTAMPPSAMLTFSTATQPKEQVQDKVFLPIHTAVVLMRAISWDADRVEQALNAALLSQLSVNGSDLAWTQQQSAGTAWYQLAGPQGLVFAVQGKSLVLSSDQATLMQLIAATNSAAHTPRIATTVAGFSHTSERPPYLHLVRVLDHTSASQKSDDSGSDAAPPFFFGNIAGLSSTFRDLDSETFTEFAAPDHTTHQTVVYQWKQVRQTH